MAAQGAAITLTSQPTGGSKEGDITLPPVSHWPKLSKMAYSNCKGGWEIEFIPDDQEIFRGSNTKEEEENRFGGVQLVVSAMSLAQTAAQIGPWKQEKNKASPGDHPQGMN